MLKNIVYSIISIIIFFAGVILYGFIIHSKQLPLKKILKEKGILEISEPKIVVDKQHYKLVLYSGKLLIKEYKAVFGKNNAHTKINIRDNITPIGEYKICSIDTTSKYHIFMRLNYPNNKDAANARMNGTISEEEYQKFIRANNQSNCDSVILNRGTPIGIEGIGKFNNIFKNLPFIFNWTNGSIALKNEDIEELYSVVHIGTSVIIRK